VRVSFDSNAWETIFRPNDYRYARIRAALTNRRLEGFICDAGFRIEAICKRDRVAYFAQPHAGWQDHGIVMRDGRSYLKSSFGPLDERHPGLPDEQVPELQKALAAGIRLMRGLNWMGLPEPQEIRDPAIFVPETSEARHEREQRQIDVFACINAHDVGQAKFNAAGGWSGSTEDTNKFERACAEWADGELVAAHIAYQNDIVCTNDCARAAGRSVFDPTNRRWLSTDYAVVFKTIDELLEIIKSLTGAAQ
jgi:hypothetical protein